VAFSSSTVGLLEHISQPGGYTEARQAVEDITDVTGDFGDVAGGK